MVKKKSNKIRSSEYAPSSLLGKIVSFWFLITITWMVLQSYVLKINLSNDILNIWVMSFLLLPFLGAIVAWKNCEPEKDGFFSKLKSLFNMGLWLAVLSVILFFIGVSYLENSSTLASIIFFILSFIIFFGSIGSNINAKYSQKRGFGDAFAMSLGQILIFLFIILFVASIVNRFNRR